MRLLSGIAAILVIGWVVARSAAVGTPSHRAAVDEAPAVPSPESAVALKYTWRIEDGSVMVANFAITNRNTYAVKDVAILCVHSGASGTRIDENERTIYQIVQAKKTLLVPDFNMGFINSQSAGSSCTIKRVTRL
jgi:hypothetical protein